MIVSIHQPQYLPWCGYIEKISRSDVFVLLDDVQFKKNEWQNRNRLCTPQGAKWITVPVVHHFGQKINEVVINNNKDWRADHTKALEFNYKKAPYYEMYADRFKSILSQSWDNLSNLNVAVIREIVACLGIETKLVCSSEIETSQDSTGRLIDLCQHFKADQYISGQDGPNYMDMDQFKKADIEIIIQSYEHPQYLQLWSKENNGDFISHLSVIDLLFNCGEKSLEVLISKNEK